MESFNILKVFKFLFFEDERGKVFEDNCFGID